MTGCCRKTTKPHPSRPGRSGASPREPHESPRSPSAEARFAGRSGACAGLVAESRCVAVPRCWRSRSASISRLAATPASWWTASAAASPRSARTRASPCRTSLPRAGARCPRARFSRYWAFSAARPSSPLMPRQRARASNHSTGSSRPRSSGACPTPSWCESSSGSRSRSGSMRASSS